MTTTPAIPPGKDHGGTADPRRAHWEYVYATKGDREVSWFEGTPALSLRLMAEAGVPATAAVVDVGGGTSRLVDALVAAGHPHVTVVDLSATALATARDRLGGRGTIDWIAADITLWTPERTYDVWHDRAAFHFLTDPADRAAYVNVLRSALRRGGIAIIGTFAPDGPEKCSGLPVARYDAAALHAVLGPDFELVSEHRHDHTTPWGSVQHFQFSTFRRL